MTSSTAPVVHTTITMFPPSSISFGHEKMSTTKLRELVAMYPKYINPTNLSRSKALYEGATLMGLSLEGKVVKAKEDAKKKSLECIPLPDTLERRVIWLGGLYIDQAAKDLYRPHEIYAQEKYSKKLYITRLLPRIPGIDIIAQVDHIDQGKGFNCFVHALSDNDAYKLIVENKGPIDFKEMAEKAFSQDPTPMLDKLGYELSKNQAAKVNDLIVYFQFPVFDNNEFIIKSTHYARVVKIEGNEIFVTSKFATQPFILHHRIDCLPIVFGNRYRIYRMKEKS